MARDSDIQDIVAAWKKHVPSEVDIGTVWKVAMAYFPESEHKEKKRGSHLYYVKWLESTKIAKLYGFTELEPFHSDGSFLLPLIKGRTVLREYIKKLMKAIEWKEQYDEIRSRQG